MFAHIVIILGILIVAGCGKRSDGGKPANPAHGRALPDLVFAANAPEFDPEGATYAEAVWIDGLWKIHDGGVWLADCRSEDEIFQAMREIRDSIPDSRILISAGGNTAFHEIVYLMRNTARAGFCRVDFLVATGSPKRANHSFPLELPQMGGSVIPDIDPFFISLDAQGAVYSGSGAARSLLDSDPADHALPKLNNQLELFAAAARACSFRPVCQVHADPAVSYQRVIDLLARFHEHRITDIQLIDSMDDERTKRPEPLKIKPLPPKTSPIIPLWSPRRPPDE